jgi:hypothetical protein
MGTEAANPVHASQHIFNSIPSYQLNQSLKLLQLFFYHTKHSGAFPNGLF